MNDIGNQEDQARSDIEPHSAPFLSLLYNSASNFLSNVISIEEDPDKKSSPGNDAPESFYSFIQEIAGISPVKEEQQIPPVVQTQQPLIQGSSSSLFDASELHEFDLPSTRVESEINDQQPTKSEVPVAQSEDLYIPAVIEKVTHDKPNLTPEIFQNVV